MARPKNTDAQKTRKRILDSAARLFSAKGVHAVGMREIAAAAEVSQPAVHHYFGSKDELHGAVLDAMYAELALVGGELQGAVLSANSLRDAIELGVRGLYRFALAHRDAVVLAMRESLESDRGIRAGRAELLGGVLLDQGAGVIAQLSGRSEGVVRMALLSLNFAVSRYITLSSNERRLLVAPALAKKKNGKVGTTEINEGVESHLVEVALLLLTGQSAV